jgi:hypothetical protein
MRGPRDAQLPITLVAVPELCSCAVTSGSPTGVCFCSGPQSSLEFRRSQHQFAMFSSIIINWNDRRHLLVSYQATWPPTKVQTCTVTGTNQEF